MKSTSNDGRFGSGHSGRDIAGRVVNYLKTKFKMQHLKYKILYIFLIFNLSLTSCGNYSFSGGDTGCAKSMLIRNFYNESGGGPATLGQTFTESMRDYFQRNTKLTLVKVNADWEFEGRIVGWTVTPVAPSGTGTSSQNRLTIKILVHFVNNQYLKEGTSETCPPNAFESEFSWYADFPQTTTLSQVENDLIQQIFDKIVFDIYTKTTSNW